MVGTGLSWVSIYIFYFAACFHSVPVLRACDALGAFLLTPARYIFEALGADQSTMFYQPNSFAGTNGLILGILLYTFFRAIWSHREKARHVMVTAPREEAKV